ncbi:MAG TPA: flagellar hook protein FlgE [Rhizomicrobium sp.]|jgi:flagellar hook protein FlgE|nr:flagellar hook protein FlgE [Rhizomicrobium sp.]
MSLYGAMMTGVAGLNAQSKALSTASSNIANVNTIGYKGGQSVFSTLLTANQGAGDVSSAGVIAMTQQNITQQGLLQTTQSSTDLGISGNGFFVVSQAANDHTTQYYTRAGDFQPDASGNLRNSAGFFLQGWPLDDTGAIPADRNALTTVNIGNLSGKAQATTNVSLHANLQSSTAAVTGYAAGDMAAGTVTPAFQRSVTVYDSQGGSQPLNVSFVKTGANKWSYEVQYAGNEANLDGTTTDKVIASGDVTFNSDGTLATPSGALDVTIPFGASSGLQPQSIKLNLGTAGGSDGLTQFDSASTLISQNVDGALFGNLTGITVDHDGFVSAQFSNGLSQKIYKVPVATFTNPDGLSAVSGNAFTANGDSGIASLNEANLGGAGQVQSNALESSTVDLATEFTNLITTQRAYSASARVVTTASDMLSELMQVVH